jgi:hypothetical protein
MESLFLLAFGEEEFFIAFAMACSEAFFNKLLIAPSQHQITSGWLIARELARLRSNEASGDV